jgi:hypothetical protein
LIWAIIVTAFWTVVSWTAWRRLDEFHLPGRTPYEVYMHGQLLAAPISWVALVVIAIRELT